VVTATTFYGNLIGTATTATNVIGGIGSLSSLTVSGITTVGFLTASNIISAGIVTAPTFVGNLTGIASTATNVIGGIGSLSSLTVSGITTVGFLTASNINVSGVVTATSFVGSATSLTDITIGIQSGGGNIGFAGTINFVNVSSVAVSSGIATVTVPITVRTTSYTVATEGQTIFPCSYTIGFIEVFFNGSKLSPTQYTANDGANVVLLEAASANDILETIGYNGFLKLAASKTILTEVSSDGLIFYTGKAAVGIATTEASWTIRRSLFSSAGIATSVGIARNISWINRSTGIYT
jgi:hypothetical protein